MLCPGLARVCECALLPRLLTGERASGQGPGIADSSHVGAALGTAATRANSKAGVPRKGGKDAIPFQKEQTPPTGRMHLRG